MKPPLWEYCHRVGLDSRIGGRGVGEERSPEAVLITGVFGSGKSSVAVEIAGVLEERDVPFAVLDLDFLAWFHVAGPDDRTSEYRMMLTNLTPVVRNYLSAGVRFLILAWTVREVLELHGLKAMLPMPLRVVRLTLPVREIETRLRSDVTTGRQDDLRRAAEQIAAYQGEGVEDLSISNDGPIRHVALEILDWLRWN
jgi:energy-coupling factor transporter ATP-binding protein EcfA2